MLPSRRSRASSLALMAASASSRFFLARFASRSASASRSLSRAALLSAGGAAGAAEASEETFCTSSFCLLIASAAYLVSLAASSAMRVSAAAALDSCMENAACAVMSLKKQATATLEASRAASKGLVAEPGPRGLAEEATEEAMGPDPYPLMATFTASNTF
jgi:hypothetical protein